MSLAVIFLSPTYNHNIPFGYLNQIMKVGINNVVILLNEDEFNLANTTKFEYFDDGPLRTLVEHYKSAFFSLKIKVINTGAAKTEQEKLEFLNQSTINEDTNIIIHEEPIQSPKQKSNLFPAPFFKNRDKHMVLYSKSPMDLVHYQWLFSIFVGLISQTLQSNEQIKPRILPELDRIIQEFKESSVNYEQAENAFDRSFKNTMTFSSSFNPIRQWIHHYNIENRANLEKKFPQLIRKTIKLYEQLSSKEKIQDLLNHPISGGAEEDNTFNGLYRINPFDW